MLPGLEPLGDQDVESLEVLPQLGHITLNQCKDCGIAAAALQIREQCVEPFDLRRDLGGQLFPLGRRTDCQQRRGHGDDSLGLARDLEGRQGRGDALLRDPVQSLADLEEGVHRGGSGQDRKSADPEERHKQAPSDSEAIVHAVISPNLTNGSWRSLLLLAVTLPARMRRSSRRTRRNRAW